MADKKINFGVLDIILALLGVIFLIGINTFFAPCGPKEDGSWMACHWAGHAVAGIAAVITIIGITHIFVPHAKIKLGLDFALLPITVLAAIIPVNLINLCGMKTMRCHTVTHPAIIVASILIIAVTIADILIQRKK